MLQYYIAYSIPLRAFLIFFIGQFRRRVESGPDYWCCCWLLAASRRPGRAQKLKTICVQIISNTQICIYSRHLGQSVVL